MYISFGRLGVLYPGTFEISEINFEPRNNLSMHLSVNECLFFRSLFVFQLSVRTDRGRGLLSKKHAGVDKGRVGGLEIGKNVRISFMDDTYSNVCRVYLCD